MSLRPKAAALNYTPPPTPRAHLASLLASLPLTEAQRREVQTSADALALDAAARVRRAAHESVQRHMHAALDEVVAVCNAVEDAALSRHLTHTKETDR
jgi:hypothetical protein